MIMARNEDGTYSQVGFVKDNAGIDTEYIYDKDGDIVFEKGFTRETSGTVPLTINGIGKDLKAWSITGNGTPTPDTPQEVKAVGDRTGNLFDYSTIRTGYRIAWATGADYADNTAMMSDYIKVKNTTYSCSNTAMIICYDGNKKYLGALNKSMVVEKEVGIFCDMFTINDNECKFIKLLAYQGVVIGNKTMLNEGSTPLPYEPYGYKIPVVTRGKNLLEPIGFSAQGIANINDYRTKTNTYGTSLSTVYGGSVLVTQANQSGTTTSYTNGFFCIVVDFSKFTTGKNYILSFDYEIKEKHSAISSSIAYIGNSTNFANISGDWGKDGRKSVKFTVKKGFNPYIEIRLCGNSIFVSNIQIEEDLTATPYEPYHEPITTPIYLPTPLYSGEVMRSDGTITRSDGTTETFTAPQIPTLNGTTVIDVDTAVKPTEMYTKYKSSK